MTDRKPFLGAIVHYVSYGTPGQEFHSQCRLAHVTETWEDNYNDVHAVVLNPTGIFFAPDTMKRSTEPRPGHWHWPTADCGYVKAKTDD